MKADTINIQRIKSKKNDTKIILDDEVSNKSKIRENIEAIIIAVILALFIRTFIIQAFKIPSGSMIPTLLIGDHILVNKFVYNVKIPFVNWTIIPFKKPQRQDIVVFKYPKDPDKDYIKRVIGIAGDIVEIKEKKVFINGKPIKDEHAYFTDNNVKNGRFFSRDNYGPEKVPENHLFVLGDNRDNSYDSRYWGFVNIDAVKGNAFIVYSSWDTSDVNWTLSDFFNINIRWGRFGHILR